MYQSIFYSHSGEDKGTCYLRDDVRGWSKFKYSPVVYRIDPEGEYKTLFGYNCTPIKEKYDWYDENILEKDLTRELAILRDYYYEEDASPSYHNILYLDIEIEMGGALTPVYIRNCPMKITAIALLDNNSKKKYCFILTEEIENIIEEENRYIIPVKTEKQLLTEFLKKYKQIDPTILSGYNSDFFDIPYLYFRILKILGEEAALSLSPIKKIVYNEYKSESPITIGGINCLDYMLLVKKYITKEESSYKLGDIGKKYASLGKIEYDGSLDKLFQENIKKYVEYNVRDVEIIEKLEEKLQFIQLTILICHLCHTPYESIYYNTVLNEGVILTYLKRKNIVSHNKPTTTNKAIKEILIGDEITNQRGTPTITGIVTKIEELNNKAYIQIKSGEIRERNLKTIKRKEGYAGGFLLQPIVGLHKWLYDEDVSSYYPSSIISLNIGVETIVCRIVSENNTRELWCSLAELKEQDPEKIITIERLNRKTFTTEQTDIKIKDLLNYILKNKYIISANGVVFRTDKKSIAAEVLEDWFAQRKEFKKLMKESYKKGDTEKGILYNQKQHSFKILLNSLYGAFAINGWRYSDGFKMCSSAITCTGQRMIMEGISYINTEIEKELLQ